MHPEEWLIFRNMNLRITFLIFTIASADTFVLVASSYALMEVSAF